MPQRPKRDKNPENMPEVCLPHFRTLTDAFREAVHLHIRLRSRGGVLREIGRHVMFEGRKSVIRRADSSQSEMEIIESSAEISAKWEDLNNIDLEYVEKKISEIAEQFQKEASQHLFKVMNEITEQTGNIIDSGGKPLTHELMLELQRKMPALSDPDGPGPTLVVHPDMLPRLRQLQEEFENSPELQSKLAALKVEKHEEYRSNQLDRELAG